MEESQRSKVRKKIASAINSLSSLLSEDLHPVGDGVFKDEYEAMDCYLSNAEHYLKEAKKIIGLNK